MRKIKQNIFFKSIAVFLSLLLLFQGGYTLFSQTTVNIKEQINEAKDELKTGLVDKALKRLLRLIRVIENRGNTTKAQLYVLLGICYEKGKKDEYAIDAYKKARKFTNDKKIVLDKNLIKGMNIYSKYFKPEKEITQIPSNVIEKERKKSKKKFPWLVVGGAVVVSVVVFLLLKKKKKEYTLTVTQGEGVEGNPDSGYYSYKEGETIHYSYSLRSGYSNLIVQLDRSEVLSSGTVEMNRNHTLTTTATPNEVNFITDNDNVVIDEGSTSTFNVRLSAQPTGDVNVTVSRVSGDEDIRVLSGSNLIFTTSNWNTYQTVTLEASEDPDTINGQATIAIRASGIPYKDIIAAEIDNDSLNFVTDKNRVSIPEGGTVNLRVRLSSQPASNVVASIGRISGDNDISTGVNLAFTPINWNTYQTVPIQASEDSDTSNGQATIRISAFGIPNKDIIATEIDNDSLNFVTNIDALPVLEGGSATFQVKLSAQPSSNINANVSRVSGDSNISVLSGSTLTFSTSNWNTYQSVTLHAAEDYDTINGQATIRISASGIPNKDITATESDNDESFPTVSITNPSDGATVSGRIFVEGNASDDEGIYKIDLYVDNEHISREIHDGSVKNIAYAFHWTTTGYSNGKHTITVKASDYIGNNAQKSINVTVYNEPDVYTLVVYNAYVNSVPIEVSPVDINGLGDDITEFSRQYKKRTLVSLEAPALWQGKNFDYWQTDKEGNKKNRLIKILIDGNRWVDAVYEK